MELEIECYVHAGAMWCLVLNLLPCPQGFCKALMTTIERLLGVLSVERLVLPTAQETESIWINKFGFRRMDEEKVSASNVPKAPSQFVTEIFPIKMNEC